MYYYIVLSIILLYSVTFSYCTGIITNPTYNLMEFSRLHLERTVSSRASISSDEYCSRSGSNYKCYNRISSNDAEFAMRIQSDQKWDLVFDDKTRGYDIQINFHRVSTNPTGVRIRHRAVMWRYCNADMISYVGWGASMFSHHIFWQMKSWLHKYSMKLNVMQIQRHESSIKYT